MPYLFDSDIIVGHLYAWPDIETLLDRLQPEGLSISSVTFFMEVFDGILGDPDRAVVEERFNALLVTVPMLSFTWREAELCARLRAELRGRGRRTRARYLDLMIAAAAMAHGLTPVSRNVADYVDVRGLALLSQGVLDDS